MVDKTLPDAVFDHIDAYVQQWMEQSAIPGLGFAVTDREKSLRVSTFGQADVAAKEPIIPETLFEIGSLGKPFTSIALLQLRDEGKLDLHSPVAGYLPWFSVRSDYAPITVHNLMNHTAGIVRGTDLGPHGLYEAWALRNTKASAPPGEYFSYSNIGYKTLGFLLEKISGQTYRDALRSRVLDPLGMSRTHPVITFQTRAVAATGYSGFYDDRPEHPSHRVAPAVWAEYSTGDGAPASTTSDMAIYLRMLLNRGMGSQNRVLSEESFDLMTLNGVWTGGDYYSYGLATYPSDGYNYIGHGGGNAGFRSAIVVDLEAGLGVVILCNRMGETDPVVAVAQDVLTAVRDAYQSRETPAFPPAVDATAIPDAADYAGDYASVAGNLHLVSNGGNLFLDDGGDAVALERRTKDTFYVGLPGFELFLLEFGRDTNGAVVEAFYGSRWYTNERYAGPREFQHPPAWEAYAGHYRARSPELSNFRVVLRKGGLILIIPWGTAEPLTPLGGEAFRIGNNTQSPETISFHTVLEGRALRADYSGCSYYRADTP